MADRSITATLRLNIQNLRAQAKEAGAALRGIGDQAKQGSEKAKTGLTQIGKSLKDNRAEWDLVSGAAFKGGAVIAAGVGLAVKTYADFDKQMSNVAATGNDARQNIDGLRETAIKLGADTQYSAGEAAQGIEELLKAGVSAADVMGGGLAGALNLAAAGQIGVAEAAETAATAMVQFKLSGQDVPHIADLLAAAAGKAQGGVGDMAMALKQSGLVASQFGLSIEETTGSLAAFASSGLLGSDAGTAFRTMLLRLANPSNEASALMDELKIKTYDANGSFVGMADLAEQLRVKLGDLSEAERNKALATIFGSDAIRAANVLYEQGSAGIQQWIGDVDDAGYAAITAATKTDNLAGDIERLGGAVDTLMIKGGKGGNNFLRGVVQGTEDAVEALSSLPEWTLSATTGIAGVGAAALLGFGGVSKLAVSVSETREAMTSLSKTAPGMATALKGMQIAGGVAVGVTALFTALSLLQTATSSAPASLGQVAHAIGELTSKGNAEALNRAFTIDSKVFKSIDGLGSAFETLGKYSNSAVYRFGELGNSILPVTSEFEQTKQVMGEVDAVLAGMDTADAAAGFLELSKQAAQNKVPVEQLIEMFPKLEEQARQLADSVDYDIQGPRELAAIMQGQYPEAMRKSLEATKGNEAAVESFGASAIGAAGSVESLTEKMLKNRDASLAAASAEIAFEQSIDDASAAAAANGRTLDVNTEKGRANKTALIGLAESSRKYIEQLKQTEGSSKKVSEATTRSTTEFLKVAKAMTGSEREAYKLAIQYGMVPKTVTTAISAPGAKPTQAEIDKINRFLAKADEGARAEILSVFMDKGAKAAQRAIDNVHSKTVTLTVKTFGLSAAQSVASFGLSSARGGWTGGQVGSLPMSLVPGFAAGGSPSLSNPGLRTSGGPVNGPWFGPKADNMLTRLNPREFVQPVVAVNDYGLDFMESVRTGQFPKELATAGVRSLADGGQPAHRQWQSARSVGSSASPVREVVREIHREIVLPNVNFDAAMLAAGDRRLKGL